MNSFQDLRPVEESLNLADKNSTQVEGKGTVEVKIEVQGGDKLIDLKNTLLVPDLRTNLLSVAKIADKNHMVLFKKDIALVKDIKGNTKMIADRIGNLYYIRQSGVHIAQKVENKLDLRLWHERMGHLNEKDLRKLLKDMKIGNIETNGKLPECEICILGKQTKSPFNSVHERAKEQLEIIHSDICGPFRVQSMGGARYF